MKIRKTLEEFFDVERKASSIINDLQKYIHEYGESVSLEMDYIPYEDGKMIVVYYTRDETEQEEIERRVEKVRLEAMQQEAKRHQYERLKAEFEKE